MKIVMDEQQYQELEDLIGIFDGMFFDDEEVQCFKFIKDIVDSEFDTDYIKKERKELVGKQLNESFEWLESLNVNIKKQRWFIYAESKGSRSAQPANQQGILFRISIFRFLELLRSRGTGWLCQLV